MTIEYQCTKDDYKNFYKDYLKDGIPDTRDDLYPQLPYAIISKTGWIKDSLPR